MYEEWLETCSEKELFVYIYSLGGSYWQVNHDLADDRYPSTPSLEQWLVDTRKEIEQGVDKTTKFGVDTPRESKESGATEEYWKWYTKMKEWYSTLEKDEDLDWLRKMPWNLEKKNA